MRATSPSAQTHAVPGGVDLAQRAAERSAKPRSAAMRRSEKRSGDAETERLGDGDGAVDEVVAVAEQRDLDTLAGQALDGERGLERGGASAGDQQVQ